MTIEQANAVNAVLRELLKRMPPKSFGAADQRLIDSAALLADKAHKVLMAGLTGDEVRAALGGAR